MAGVKGSLIGMTINGAFVSCETACNFSEDVEMLPASSVTSGRWKEYIPGDRGWSMSVDGNLLLESVAADIKTVLAAIDAGLPVVLEFRTRASATTAFIISGSALPSAANITAGGKGSAGWTVNFQGTGPLSLDLQNYSTLINAMPAVADYQIIVEENQI